MPQTLYETFESYFASANATATGTQSTTTLQDTTQAWTVNAFAGMYVSFVSGTGAAQQRLIASNTANTLTWATAVTTAAVSGSTVYRIGQVPTGWAEGGFSAAFVTDVTNPIGGTKSFGLPGQSASGGAITNVPALRTGSTAAADSSSQFSQKLTLNGTTGSFIGHLGRSNSAASQYAFVKPNFAAGTAALWQVGTIGFLTPQTVSIGSGWAAGNIVTSKFETQAVTSAYGTYTQMRYKVWLASNAEPSSFTAVYNDFGTSIANPGNGGYSAGPAIAVSSPGSPTIAATFYGNIVGGALNAVLIGNCGQGYAANTTYNLTFSGGGLTGTVTATATTDAYGCFAYTTVSSGGASGNNSPVVTISGAGGGAVLVACDSSGYVRAAKITAVGNYSSNPTFTISSTGTGASAAILVQRDLSGTGALGVSYSGYRGVVGSIGTAAYGDPFIDNYFEGSNGTTFGGGVAIAPNDSHLYYSPANWNVTSSQAVCVNMGAYVKGGFSGTSLQANFNQNNAGDVVMWSVDGGAFQTATLAAGTSTLSLATGLTAANHTFEMHFETSPLNADRWNTPVDGLFITGYTIDTGATMIAYTPLSAIAYFFGDSITEGILAGNNGQHSHIATASRKLAREWGCEYGACAFGGSGLDGTNSQNVPGFTSGNSYQSVYNGVSRMSGSLFAVQPNYVLLNHGVNGTWYAADLAQALINLRAAAPAAIIFQIVPFGQQGVGLMVGKSLTGAVASSTSTSLTINASLPTVQGANGQQLILTAVSPGGVQQQRSITGAGGTIAGGTTTLPITAAWTTNPDSTYTYYIETAIENYRRLYPSDSKLFQINLGAGYATGIPGGGGATAYSGDGLHPNWIAHGDNATALSQAMYAAMTPAGSGARSYSYS